jgi:hypothetical protein
MSSLTSLFAEELRGLVYLPQKSKKLQKGKSNLAIKDYFPK